MRCPGCGIEVMEQAVFCHKCGERLDSSVQQFSANKQQGSQQATADPAAALGSDAVATPADRLRQAVPNRADDVEQMVWAGGFSPKAMLGDWILTGLVTVALIVAGVLWANNGLVWLILIGVIAAIWIFQALRFLYRRVGVRYEMTTQRFMHESGILRRVTNRIEVIDIDDITVEQGIIERMTGVGTIHIVSSDRTTPDLMMPGIDNARQVAGTIDEVRRQERRRRGLHIESI